MSIEFNSKEELYNYLNTFDFESVRDCKMAGVYFLVEYEDKIWPMYFMSCENAWFESPCSLSKFPLEYKEVADMVRDSYLEEEFDNVYEHEMTMQKDGWHYSIENFQYIPFLPDKIKIIDVFSDVKCMEWLLAHQDDAESC